MKTCSTTKPLPIEDQVPAFEKDLANADTMRGATLSRLQVLLASKTKHTEREQELIAAERGKDDPGAVMLKAEVADNQRFVRELRAEGDRAATGTVVADKRSWILHGFVRNRDLEGQPNLTVALFSRPGQWIEVLGHACTDERGYFNLRYTPSGGPGPAKEGEATPDAATQRELFIWVSNSKQEVLYRDKKPTTALLGQVKYREIILDGEGECCSPPPSEPPSDMPPPKPATSSAQSSAKASKTQRARVTKKKAPKKKP